MASKPYAASGKYIQRMSNHCKGCRLDPALSVGESACPFTTLYWDFLLRHEDLLKKNPRMAMQLKNLARLDLPARDAIRAQASAHRQAQLPTQTGKPATIDPLK
jgi:deoxyribodipyrimidine photolyase-related protein